MAVILEQNKTFSESLVWQTSRNYYIEKGVSAWSESVPFYITSNAFIANQYADILLATMQSWVQKNQPSSPVCFPLLEIGAGCGQLAYSVIRALNEKISTLKITAFSFRYIISDLSLKTLSFIAEHPLFAPYVESGQCRFSHFDLEQDDCIELLPVGGQAKETLTIDTPLLLIANYLFDSLSSDVFYLNDDSIKEARVTLTTEASNLSDTNTPKNWEAVNLSFEHFDIAPSHYEDPIINSVLYAYEQALTDTHMIFPIGSLRAIQRLQRIAQQPLLILLSDKCFNTSNEMANQAPPELDVHGSFSTMVNLDALAKYTELKGGTAVIPTPRDGLTTAALAFDMDPSVMPLLQYSIQQHLERFSPTDFFNLYELITEQHEQWSLAPLVSALSLSHWDPGLFSIMVDHLHTLLENSDSQVVDYLLSGLPQVASQFYPIPAAEDIYFQIGSLYYTLDDYEKAIEYYQRSLIHYPGDDETLFNLALCYLYQGDYTQAKQALTRCISLEPNKQTYLDTYQELEELLVETEKS